MSDTSVGFRRPPLDDTLTLDQMYDWHRVHSAEFGTFRFDNDANDLNSPLKTLTWKELGEGIIRGLKTIEDCIPEIRDGAPPSAEEGPVVVGILATSDVITYTAFIFAHIRLTHPASSRRALLPFPISTRNSPAAVSHLIAVTGAKYLWITDGPMKSIVDQALSEGGLSGTTLLQMPSFSTLFPPHYSPVEIPGVDNTPVSLETPAVILHSSGSSSFPKTRTINHRILLEWSRGFDQGELGEVGEPISVHALPAHHAVGMFLSCWAPVTGYIRCVPSPLLPPVPATPEYLLEQVVKSKCRILVIVPIFLEIWSKEPKSIEILRKLKSILWGGALLRPEIGRYLFQEGLMIQSAFGATEFGIVTFMAKKPHPEGYEWFKFLPQISPVLIPEPGQGIFELAFQNSKFHHVAVVNTVIDGTPAYTTDDLVQRHPDNPDLFRILGRKDDQIMLSTGEKTNPGPLETIIITDKHVKSAIVFGRGRFQNGILIEPESYEDSERLGLENFRNLIWPSIEAANKFAPAHSRIFKEMILTTSPSKPFQYTFKGNVQRAATLNDYEAEVDGLYTLVEESVQADIPIPGGSSDTGGWRLDESTRFVSEVINRVMKTANGVQENDDIFTLGCDSLQATYIRNSLLHALRQVLPPSIVQTVPSNFVYQQPTVGKLARYVVEVTQSGTKELDPERARIDRLETMVARYTGKWPIHRPSKDSYTPGSETILLTGSTGALGSQLLAQLLVIPTVSRVYALNRPARDGRSSLERQTEAFIERGNDVTLLDSTKIIFVEGDTSIEGFGIDPVLYNEIRDSVTTIIHNAWRVDFNMSLSSFEPAIRGVRLLIDFALQLPHQQPPRMMFTSSIGIIKGWADVERISEDPITEDSLVNPSGYGESKWVSERIISAAGQETALRPVIVRIGQLSGGINGNWNPREWFPALVRASQVVGGIPEKKGVVSFLPLHIAASSIIELRRTRQEVVHIVHPRPVLWMSIVKHIGISLDVPLIPYEEWLERLAASPTTNDALHDNPALHLLGVYRGAIPPSHVTNIDEKEFIGMATQDTARTLTEAPSLRPENLPQLGTEDVDSWIRYWRRKGTLHN